MAQNGQKKRRGPGRPIQKGQTLNPGGLPLWVREMRALAGSHSKEAIERLVQLMRQKKNPRIAKEATDSLLDRAGLKGFCLEPDRHEIVSHDAGDAIGRLASLVARRLAVERQDVGPASVVAEPEP